jgi:hypothetical protein
MFKFVSFLTIIDVRILACMFDFRKTFVKFLLTLNDGFDLTVMVALLHLRKLNQSVNSYYIETIGLTQELCT